ncbi:MAG: hypothetical protein ABIQ66_01005 [Novosphingobium sp.]
MLLIAIPFAAGADGLAVFVVVCAAVSYIVCVANKNGLRENASMFTHLVLGSNDIASAHDFYEAALAPLGAPICAIRMATRSVPLVSCQIEASGAIGA